LIDRGRGKRKEEGMKYLPEKVLAFDSRRPFPLVEEKTRNESN